MVWDDPFIFFEFESRVFLCLVEKEKLELNMMYPFPSKSSRSMIDPVPQPRFFSGRDFQLYDNKKATYFHLENRHDEN